ncbi:MAG TPA: hypothetical protein VIK57_24730 [Streptosporangiaceae bacterium]
MTSTAFTATRRYPCEVTSRNGYGYHVHGFGGPVGLVDGGEHGGVDDAGHRDADQGGQAHRAPRGPVAIRAGGELCGHDAAEQIALDGEEAEDPDDPAGEAAAADDAGGHVMRVPLSRMAITSCSATARTRARLSSRATPGRS